MFLVPRGQDVLIPDSGQHFGGIVDNQIEIRFERGVADVSRVRRQLAIQERCRPNKQSRKDCAMES